MTTKNPIGTEHNSLMKNTEVVYSATESSVQEYKQDNLESGSVQE
jgi:hypothetical protein